MRLSDRLAFPIVCAGFIFLVLMAYGVHRLIGPTAVHHGAPMSLVEEILIIGGMLLLWPVFICELVLFYLLRDREKPFWKNHWYGLVICLFPPLRLGATSYSRHGYLWFPSLGWQRPTRDLRKRLERIFMIPMVIIALLVLPVLAIEWFYASWIEMHFWLAYTLELATALIWFAFTLEFIIMASIARKRLTYCKEHWLDLAIIILPYISFIRSMRVMYLWRLAYLQQVGRMSRLYRLRGLALKLLRSVLLLGIVQRILERSPEKKLARLEEALELAEEQVAELKAEIAVTKRQMEEMEEQGCKPDSDDPARQLSKPQDADEGRLPDPWQRLN